MNKSDLAALLKLLKQLREEDAYLKFDFSVQAWLQYREKYMHWMDDLIDTDSYGYKAGELLEMIIEWIERNSKSLVR